MPGQTRDMALFGPIELKKMQLVNGLKVQARVIEALMLREIHTINGDSKLGYLWVLIQTAFGVAIFWAIRDFVGARAPHGMPMPYFLSSGFCLFGVFSDVIQKSLTAISANRPLLTFPQVTTIDVMISRMLVIASTQYVVLSIFFALGWLFGFPLKIHSFGLILFVLITSPLLAFGIGMILTSLAAYLPVLNKIVPMAMRILFFASGVFFSTSAFGQKIAHWLLFNPILQLIEMFRVGVYSSYKVEGLSITYVMGVTVGMLAVGGVLEIGTRRRRLSND